MKEEIILFNAQVELQKLITEREGMIAENKQREHLGQSMAYWEDSFMQQADKFDKLIFKE